MTDVIAAVWGFVSAALSFCWSIISSAWYLLSWVPIFGGMIQTIVLIVVGVVLYRVAPRRVQILVSSLWDQVQNRLPGWMSEPIRWLRWILSATNRAERPQTATAGRKRTVAQALRLRLFWMVVGAILYALAANWASVEAWVHAMRTL